MRYRKTISAAHLALGLAAGLVLASMAGSGILLAFAPQVSDWADRNALRVAVPEGVLPLSPGALARAAGTAYPGGRLESLAFRPEAGASVRVGLGREGMAYLDPYTGAALGRATSLRKTFTAIEHWHRWMGEAKRGKALTQASAIALALLALSGAILWIPRPASWRAFRRAAMPAAGARRSHMALGFWSGSALLAIAGTGIAMAYSGLAKPRGAKEARGTQEVRGSPGARSDGGRVEEAAWDSAYALAKARSPGWRTLAIRKPRDPDGPLTALIEREGFLRFPLRSRLEVDARTGRERKWEPYSAKGWGGGWRAWMVPLHTGRGFGWAGQAGAGLASGSLLLLIATGARLAWRRRRPR